jgi:hypothetical protein
VGVYDFVVWRAGEHGEPTVLRGDQCNGIALVVDKLGSSQVAGPAELRRLGDHWDPSIDRFCDDYLGDYRRALAPDNLGAKRQQFVIRVDQRRASTAVRPANSSIARPKASSHRRFGLSRGTFFIRAASPENAGATE